jgi:hypothetical protein
MHVPLTYLTNQTTINMDHKKTGNEAENAKLTKSKYQWVYSKISGLSYLLYGDCL